MDLDARIERLREQAEQVQESIRTATATVASPDESVTVTVGAGGILTDVRFGQRAYERPPQQLAGLLMQLVGKAQRQVSADVTASFADLVGENSSAMSVLDQFRPADPDEDEQPPEPEPPAPPPPPPTTQPPPRPVRRPPPAHEYHDEQPDSWLGEWKS